MIITSENELNKQKCYDILAGLLNQNENNISYFIHHCDYEVIINQSLDELLLSNFFIRYIMLSQQEEIKNCMTTLLPLALVNIVQYFLNNEVTLNNICCVNTLLLILLQKDHNFQLVHYCMSEYDALFSDGFLIELKRLCKRWDKFMSKEENADLIENMEESIGIQKYDIYRLIHSIKTL